MALVEIPTTKTLDGLSPELLVRQRIDENALPNLLAFAAAFCEKFGRKLVVTEGARSRARQDYLWENRKQLGIAVARPYSSRHDEVSHGTALDLGSNIAIEGSPEQKWAAGNCGNFGLSWTGTNFNEAWHYEVTTITAASAAKYRLLIEEEDMDSTQDARLKNVETILANLQNAIGDPKNGVFVNAATATARAGNAAEIASQVRNWITDPKIGVLARIDGIRPVANQLVLTPDELAQITKAAREGAEEGVKALDFVKVTN